MSKHYILIDREPVVESDLIKWARWFGAANRVVDNTAVDDAEVSTVFLGLDHQFGNGPPLLFETMIFGGRYDEDQWRYSTWDEAVEGHDAAVALLQAETQKER